MTRATTEYHTRQQVTRYRSTVALGEFLARLSLSDRRPINRVIDFGAGAGATTAYLTRLAPSAEWTLYDSDEHALTRARELFAAEHAEIRVFIEVGDFSELTDRFAPGSFDVGLSVQTLSWLPHYRDVLPDMLKVVRGGYLVVTSLFTTTRVECIVQATDYAAHPDAVTYFYNVYCLERFVALAEACGAELVSAIPFHIDLDLEPPPRGGLGTYTVEAKDGRRLQFTGDHHLPWMFVVLRA